MYGHIRANVDARLRTFKHCEMYFSVDLCFLYSVVSSRTAKSASQLVADLFIPIPTGLPWEAMSYAAINARRQFAHIFSAVYNQTLIYLLLSQLGRHGKNETVQASKKHQRGFEKQSLSIEIPACVHVHPRACAQC